MQTIIVTTTEKLWREAQKVGKYTQSTINSKLDDIGFIHATNPDQIIAMLNRHFTDQNSIILLLIDIDKVKSEVRLEASLSGRVGLFPHIYGPLNLDAVYGTVIPKKDTSNNFVASEELVKLI
jgi:uncharacterized protein (DUF952 family)